MPTVTLTKYQHELLLALAQEHHRDCITRVWLVEHAALSQSRDRLLREASGAERRAEGAVQALKAAV